MSNPPGFSSHRVQVCGEQEEEAQPGELLRHGPGDRACVRLQRPERVCGGDFPVNTGEGDASDPLRIADTKAMEPGDGEEPSWGAAGPFLDRG